VLAAVASLVVIAGRHALILENTPFAGNPSVPGNSPSPQNSSSPGVSPSPAYPSPIPRAMYAFVVARPLLEGRVATAEAVRTLREEHVPNDVAADRVRTQILPLLRQMRDRAESTLLDDPEVVKVHEHAIKGARLNVSGFEIIANALEQNDPELLQKGNALVEMASAEWEEWAKGTLKL
jgi:hypothetical protein